jgi:hypothetical protein
VTVQLQEEGNHRLLLLPSVVLLCFSWFLSLLLLLNDRVTDPAQVSTGPYDPLCSMVTSSPLQEGTVIDS